MDKMKDYANTDAQLREIAKWQTVCILLIFFNLVVMSALPFMGTIDVFGPALKDALDKPLQILFVT